MTSSRAAPVSSLLTPQARSYRWGKPQDFLVTAELLTGGGPQGVGPLLIRHQLRLVGGVRIWAGKARHPDKNVLAGPNREAREIIVLGGGEVPGQSASSGFLGM